MPRRRAHPPLRVYLNTRLLGHLSREKSGAISFHYDPAWLNWEHAFAVSLSLPLRPDAHRGDPVTAVFDNLLPDAPALRKQVAAKLGAGGTDAYSLLAAIGQDCVGALRFLAADAPEGDPRQIEAECLSDTDIEALLNNLSRAPLGLSLDNDFRLSLAGAQEKTALLWHDGQWKRPHGATPTSHIFKTQIGKLTNGVDLNNSVENEHYCLTLLQAFDLKVAQTKVRTFGETTALVIERFDRHWTKDRRLLRRPQEDLCQALSILPTDKYQANGGPGMVKILELLKGSDSPAEDQATFLKAQILFWLIGATDGHAKNFSVFLGPGGGYHLTPLYDVLTTKPNLSAGQGTRPDFKMAMSVGRNRHYRIDEIAARHFQQTADEAKLPRYIVNKVIEEIADTFEQAFEAARNALPQGFPTQIPDAVEQGARSRRGRLAVQGTPRTVSKESPMVQPGSGLGPSSTKKSPQPKGPTLSIDGGASGTRARIVSGDGATLGSGEGGPGSLTLGVEATWTAIHTATAAALKDAKLSVDAVQSMPVGAALAGTGNPQQRAAFLNADPLGGRLTLMSDGYAWLIGALGGQPGIVAALGTGVAVHRLTTDGRARMTSGWGFPVGDEGGGAAIGLQAARHLLMILDGRVEGKSSLSQLVGKAVGVEPAGVQAWLLDAGATAYASLAPLVFTAANDGDRTAASILSGAGRDIALAITALDRPTPAEHICLVGGLAAPLTPWLPETLTPRLILPRGDVFEGVRMVLTGEIPAETP